MENSNERPLGWTTAEDAKKLVDAGLNPDTADMYWAPDAGTVVPTPYITKTDNETLIPAYKGAIPCWSLGVLIQMLPSNIQTGDSFLDEYDLEFKLHPSYMLAYCISQSHHPMVFTEKHETLIEACVEMVLWLIENKLI